MNRVDNQCLDFKNCEVYRCGSMSSNEGLATKSGMPSITACLVHTGDEYATKVRIVALI